MGALFTYLKWYALLRGVWRGLQASPFERAFRQEMDLALREFRKDLERQMFGTP